MDFDFDYWKKLFETDEDEFNKQRLIVIEAEAVRLGCNTDSVNRILAVINGNDMVLSRVKNPVSRQAILEAQFTEQVTTFVNGLNKFVFDVRDIMEGTFEKPTEQLPNNVVSFQRDKKT